MEQARFVAEDKPEDTRRSLGDRFTSVSRLTKLSKRGRQRPELTRADLRELDFRGFRVVYRVEKRQVTILTVPHGRRLFDSFEVGE